MWMTILLVLFFSVGHLALSGIGWLKNYIVNRIAAGDKRLEDAYHQLHDIDPEYDTMMRDKNLAHKAAIHEWDTALAEVTGKKWFGQELITEEELDQRLTKIQAEQNSFYEHWHGAQLANTFGGAAQAPMSPYQLALMQSNMAQQQSARNAYMGDAIAQLGGLFGRH